MSPRHPLPGGEDGAAVVSTRSLHEAAELGGFPVGHRGLAVSHTGQHWLVHCSPASPGASHGTRVPWLRSTRSSGHQTVALGVGTSCSAPGRGQVLGALPKRRTPAPSLPGTSLKGHRWHERVRSQLGPQQPSDRCHQADVTAGGTSLLMAWAILCRVPKGPMPLMPTAPDEVRRVGHGHEQRPDANPTPAARGR